MKAYLTATIIGAALLFAMFSLSSIQTATAGIEPLPFLENKLNAVLNVLSTQSDRLDKIAAAGSNPPDDGIPAALAALDDIQFQCKGIDESANAMKGDFSRGTGADSNFSFFLTIPSIQYATAQSTPPDDIKPDPALANKLSSIANVLSSMNKRMDKIKEAGANPPDDQIPAVLEALDGIIGACTHISETAKILNGEISRPEDR